MESVTDAKVVNAHISGQIYLSGAAVNNNNRNRKKYY